MKSLFPLKNIFLVALMFFMHTGSFAQREVVAELTRKLNNTSDPHARINLYNKIAYEIRIYAPDSAMDFARHALALGEKENYQYGIAVSNICLSHANSAKANYELGVEYAKKALVIGDNLQNDSIRGAANLVIATCHYNKSNYDLSIEKAILAIQYYKKINNNDGITKARLAMAQVYQLKDDLPEAVRILQDVSRQKQNDVKVQVNAYHTLANIYGMQGKYDSALALDAKGLAICEAHDLKYLKSPLYDNMANCFMYAGQFVKAREYFYRCIDLDSSFGNKKQMADTYLNLGQLALMEKNNNAAVASLKHSISLSEASGYRQGTYSAYLLLSKAYSLSNQKDSALIAVNKGYIIKDSVINESSENKIAEYETLFQAEKKEQELKIQKDEINKKNYFLVGLCLAIFLITLSGVLYFRKRSLQNKIDLQNEVLKQQDLAAKAIIEAEENERKRIAADLHDGVGQMMSAAKMNLSVFEHELSFSDDTQKEKFENVISMVDASCREIRNVSHQMMPNALLKSGLSGAVKEFISKIDTRIIKVTLHTEGLNERLEANVETVLYRVIQESVNNVLKHSGANHLDISIIKDHEGISATVEDNGKGFHVKEAEQSNGIGLKNSVSRIKYLQGTIDFHSTPGSGTVVAIHIPVM